MLERLFDRMDSLADSLKVFKIDTIGDGKLEGFYLLVRKT